MVWIHTTICRNSNFRYSDISSVLQSKNKLEYIKRIFSKGDNFILPKIKLKNPESDEYEGGLKRMRYIFVDDIEDPPHNSFTVVLESAEESIL